MRDLAAQQADEVIVCDDGNNGDSLREASSLGIRVIPAGPRPEGWIGKNWACWQLAQEATGDVLIFADADTRWKPGTLDAILAARTGLQADLLSVLPRLEDLTLSARILTPLVENIVLTMAPWPLLSWDRLGMGAASGALIAIGRDAYETSGGHAAIAGQILEDVALARAVQHTTLPGGRRGRSRLVLGDRLYGAVIYRSYTESVHGFGKSLVAVHEGSRVATAASVATFAATHTLPWLLPGSRWVWGLRIAGLLDRTLVAIVAGRRNAADLAEGLLGPITPLLGLPALVIGMRRRLTWKGRDYPLSAARPAPRTPRWLSRRRRSRLGR